MKEDKIEEKAKRMLALFACPDKHHATYDHTRVIKPEAGGKVEIRPLIDARYETVTPEMWTLHLRGERPLGISPLLRDNTCMWGTIDYDNRKVELPDLHAKVAALGLPLTICRSKSGGAHLHLFLSEPVGASEVRRVLRRMVNALGMPRDTEIFPKQDSWDDVKHASWLNMPYFGGDQTDRYAVKKGGLEMSVAEFLAEAEKSRTPLDQADRALHMKTKQPDSSAPTAAEFERWLSKRLRDVAEAQEGDANETLWRVCKEIGRWSAVLPPDKLREDDAKQRTREAWRERGKEDGEFAKTYDRLHAKGLKIGDPPRDGERQNAIVQRLSDIAMTHIEWLWPGRVAVGKISMLAGHPGLGKSQLTMYLAAMVSTGGSWPFDEGRAPHGRVLVLSAEDDAADTLRPRFEAAGGNAGMVDLLTAVRTEKGERGLSLETDIRELDRVLSAREDYKLVVIDPISAYMGKIDTNRNSDVRGLLAPVQKLAERHRVAVVCVSHLIKAGGREAIGAVTGSGAFVAAARFVCSVSKEIVEEEDADGRTQKVETGRRLLAVAKNNLGPDGSDMSLAYRVETAVVGPGIEAPRVVWDERIAISADEAIGYREAASSGRRPGKREEAEALLRLSLRGGRMASKELEAAAMDRGISSGTLKNAKKALGVESEKDGAGAWYCFLPGRQSELPI